MVGPLVTTNWLAAHLGESDLRVVDGSWHLRRLERDARKECAEAHIPGAVFFDIDEIADKRTSLPHMLPRLEEFGRAVGALGIGDGDRVVVYNTRAAVRAARVCCAARVLGEEPVAVLDGGLPKWRAEGRPVDSGVVAPAPRRFTPRLRAELVRDLAAIRANLASRREQVLDARSRGRFLGREPEPRPGLRGGHIPGSRNLPYDTLYRPDETLHSTDQLRRALERAGIDLARPVVTTCGSGVTASVLALALHLVGCPDTAVYDGSGGDWGGGGGTPGSARPPRRPSTPSGTTPQALS